ncbi:MAG: hypothetical protein AAF696_08660 [Bacteroidota bacterium]
MFLPHPFKRLGLLIYLYLGLLPLSFAELPSNYEEYDVNFYELEIKLDSKYQRIVGTSQIQFKALRNIGFIQLDLEPFMEVASVRYKGQNLRFDHRDGRLRLSFGRQLRANTEHEVSIVFYGAPAISESVMYTGGILWDKDAIGKELIVTRKGSKGTGIWWPHKYDPRDPAEGMNFSIIYPREVSVTAPGRLKNIRMLPGEFKRWTYAYNHEVHCGSVEFGIGNVLRARSNYQGQSGNHELTAYTVPGQYKLAIGRLKKAQEILAFMENYFGEYPYWDRGFHLFEAGFFTSKSREIYEGIEDVEQTEAWLFDVIISDWLGRSVMEEGEKDLWMFNMFKRYCESLYVSHLEGESAGIKYLQGKKNESRYQSAWMLHGLRRTLDDEQLWWEMLRSLFSNYRGNIINSEDLYAHLYATLGPENQYYWTQYFQLNQVPVLELKTKRKGKKMTISYRWDSGVPGFELPINLWIFDEKHRLSPNETWQVFNSKKVSEKHINVENPLGLFEVRRGKM